MAQSWPCPKPCFRSASGRDAAAPLPWSAALDCPAGRGGPDHRGTKQRRATGPDCSMRSWRTLPGTHRWECTPGRDAVRLGTQTAGAAADQDSRVVLAYEIIVAGIKSQAGTKGRGEITIGLFMTVKFCAKALDPRLIVSPGPSI